MAADITAVFYLHIKKINIEYNILNNNIGD